MAEKIVNVEVPMFAVLVEEEGRKPVVRFKLARGDLAHSAWCIPERNWTPAMHAAAESLRREGGAGELAEDELLDDCGRHRLKLHSARFDGFSLRWPKGVGNPDERFCTFGDVVLPAEDMVKVLAWHSRHYTLLPDECREPGKPPRKLEADEVQGVNGEPCKLEMRHGECVATTSPAHVWLLFSRDEDRFPDSPFRNPAQYARGLSFWSRNAPASLCIDGNGTREMGRDECRDLVTGQARTMVVMRDGAGSSYVDMGCPFGWYADSEMSERTDPNHPCSNPGQRLRVEGFLKSETTCSNCRGTGHDCAGMVSATCPDCNGTGRTKEESDATDSDRERLLDGAQRGQEQAAHELSPTDEPDVALAAGLAGPEPAQPMGTSAAQVASVRDGGIGPAVGDTAPDVAEANSVPVLSRPEGVPASATVWAEVVDGLGRKVGAWFEPKSRELPAVVAMSDPDEPEAPFYWRPVDGFGVRLQPELSPSAAAQCRQLYERGLRETADLSADPNLPVTFDVESRALPIQSNLPPFKMPEPKPRPACLPAKPAGPSPAAGPAPVFGRDSAGDDPGPIADGLHWEKRPDGAEVLRSSPKCWKCNDTGVIAPLSNHGDSEPCKMCKFGAAAQLRELFAVLTPEQVVAAMSKETRRAMSRLLVAGFRQYESGCFRENQAQHAAMDRAKVASGTSNSVYTLLERIELLVSARDEALARAEKAEESLRQYMLDAGDEYTKVCAALTRAEDHSAQWERLYRDVSKRCAEVTEKHVDALRMLEGAEREFDAAKGAIASLNETVHTSRSEESRLASRIHSLETTLATTSAALTRAESAWKFANVALEGTQDKLAAAQDENRRLGGRNAGLLNEVDQLRAAERKQVDLGELREAFKALGNVTYLKQGWSACSVNNVLAAVEKLLSEGGVA